MCSFLMKASSFADHYQSTRSKKGTWEQVERRTASVSIGTGGWLTCGLWHDPLKGPTVMFKISSNWCGVGPGAELGPGQAVVPGFWSKDAPGRTGGSGCSGWLLFTSQYRNISGFSLPVRLWGFPGHARSMSAWQRSRKQRTSV